ncbi:MAG: hypothetical protein Kow0075_04630 [Salibacteraceae bacterium]
MAKVFPIKYPPIPSAGVYYFTSDAGINYEVRFGRKQSDILCANIVFGATNEEFDGEEYVLTKKGEFFSVMKTIEVIINHFIANNPNIHTFEFAGEPLDENEEGKPTTKRTRVYLRQAKKIFSPDRWRFSVEGNKVKIERI